MNWVGLVALAVLSDLGNGFVLRSFRSLSWSRMKLNMPESTWTPPLGPIEGPISEKNDLYLPSQCLRSQFEQNSCASSTTAAFVHKNKEAAQRGPEMYSDALVGSLAQIYWFRVVV